MAFTPIGPFKGTLKDPSLISHFSGPYGKALLLSLKVWFSGVGGAAEATWADGLIAVLVFCGLHKDWGI